MLKNKWFFVSLLLAIVLGLAIFTKGFGVEKLLEPKAEILASEAIDYINKNVLTGNTTATLISSQWLKNGLCQFTLEIAGQQFDSYVSKDGEYLFPETFKMKEKEKEAPIEEKVETPVSQEFPKTKKPKVELFVMSFCPYGNQAEEIMKSVAELLDKKAEIGLNYVIYDNYAQAMNASFDEYCLDKEEQYCSMHGRGEINQDVREICLSKYQPDKFWQFVEKINSKTNSSNVDGQWKAIAQELKINVATIEKCEKNEAKTLLQKEVELNRKYGVQGSPTLIINEVEYQGGRTSEDYKQAICSAFQEEPEECKITLSSGSTQAQGSCQ